jgi:hypothetical protein
MQLPDCTTIPKTVHQQTSRKAIGPDRRFETPTTHVHVVEPFVDLLEVTVVGDKLVDPELAVHVVYRAKRFVTSKRKPTAIGLRDDRVSSGEDCTYRLRSRATRFGP